VNNFVNVLLQNSELKQAKLYNAAKKAAENPSIGITINNPAAAHVIKDCAEITMKCLPLYVFANYENPFQQLKSKFTKQDIVDLILQTKADPMLLLLLELITTKAKKEFPRLFEATQTFVSNNVANDDPYGDYYSERVVAETKQRTVEEILFEAFGCQK
jgi:hypothetical protein